MSFTTAIHSSSNKTGIQIAEQGIPVLNAGKRPPVAVTLNGRNYEAALR